MPCVVEIVNGKPVLRPIDCPPFIGPIKPEFKKLYDPHQDLLQESKALNDIARGWYSLNF